MPVSRVASQPPTAPALTAATAQAAKRVGRSPEADAQLRNRHHHEQARELGVLCVNAGGGGMDGAGAQ